MQKKEKLARGKPFEKNETVETVLFDSDKSDAAFYHDRGNFDNAYD